MTDRRPHTDQLTTDRLLDELAQRDEAEAAGGSHASADADSTFKVLKAELDTLASQLREPAPVVPFEDESDCRRVTELVEALGLDPSLAAPTPADLALAESDPLGDLGQYKLLAKLGEGGMGTVYKALHTRLDKIVALKVLPRQKTTDPHAVARFEREMRAVGKLEHAHIVRAMDANVHERTHYLVMEYIDGVDLSELVHRVGPLPVADACELVRQAAIGLQHAHEHGLVHRDLKPSNLMLSTVGSLREPNIRSRSERATLKILDLGLARLHADLLGELTSTGQMMGTVDYMAPEQTGDSHDVDIRADIYGLGATLFKLLTDRAPYADKRCDTMVKKLNAVATRPVPSVRDHRTDVPEELDAIIKRMLAKDADDRYATPQEVVDALQPFVEQCDLLALMAACAGDSDVEAESAKPVLSSTEQYLTDAMTDTTTARDAEVALADLPDAVAGLPTEPPDPTEGLTEPGRPAVGSRAGSGDPRPARSHTARDGQRNRVLTVAAAIGGILLLGIVTLYFQTRNGTLVVEIDDPEGLIQVSVVGQDIVIADQQKAGEPITLRPGDHKLHVTRGELSFDSDNFTLKRGEETVVTVKLAEGRVQVVSDQRIIGHRDMPATPIGNQDRDRLAAQAVLALGGRIECTRVSDSAALGWMEQVPAEPFYLTGVDYSATRAHVRDADLKVLAGLTQLQVVNLYGIHAPQSRDGLTDAGISHLANVSTLTALQLGRCPKITDAALQHLANLPELRNLGLEVTQVTGGGLAHLRNCDKLRELVLNECPVTDKGLSALPPFPELAHLQLAHTLITEASIGTLERLPKLERLHLIRTDLTGAAISRLSRLPSLTHVAVGPWQEANEFWRDIGKLKHLRSLGTIPQVDDDLKSFASLTELEVLYLNGSPITDEGLAHLTPMKALRILEVQNTNVTPTGVAKLKRELPACAITSNFSDEQIAAAMATIDGSPALARKASPLDKLRREDIDAYELQVAGGGDAAKGPAELVAILGDSRLKHWASVSEAIFTDAGRTLITGGTDGTVRTWDVATGRQVRVFHLPGRVFSMALTPDGKSLFVSSENGAAPIYVVNTITGEPIREPNFGGAFLALSPDGNKLVSGSSSGSGEVALHDAVSGELLFNLGRHNSSVSSVAVHPLGKVAASASLDNSIKLWDLITGTELRTLTGHAGWVNAVAFSPDGKLLASASHDGTVRLWDPTTSELKQTLYEKDNAFTALAFSLDGTELAVGEAQRGIIALWDVSSGKQRPTLQCPDLRETTSATVYSPEGTTLMSGSFEGQIRLWDLASGKPRIQPTGPQGQLSDSALSPDGTLLATSSNDGTVTIWDLTRQLAPRTIQVSTSQVMCAAFSPDGKTLATGAGYGGSEYRVLLWDVASGRQVKEHYRQWNVVTSLAFTPDGTAIVSGCHEDNLVMVDIATGEVRRKFASDGRTSRLTVSPDGKFVASIGVYEGDKTVTLYDATTGEVVHRSIHTAGVARIAFSPDNKTFATGCLDGTVHIWDVATGEARRVLRGHQGYGMGGLTFAPDGKTLWSTAGDGTARQWDPEAPTGTPALQRTIQFGPPLCWDNLLTITPDGRHLITANANGTIYVLRVDQSPTTSP